MKCNHFSFLLDKHTYCPECGETNINKICDERYIVRMEKELFQCEHKIEALKQALQLAIDEIHSHIDKNQSKQDVVRDLQFVHKLESYLC